MTKPILCVDFDGVIHSYTSGWKGACEIPDPPVPGVFPWLIEAQEYWNVQIYSSRSKELGAIALMKAWITQHALRQLNNAGDVVSLIANLSFPTEKPAAFLTIDDRCVRFDGDWSDPALDPATLLSFKPWNKK